MRIFRFIRNSFAIAGLGIFLLCVYLEYTDRFLYNKVTELSETYTAKFLLFINRPVLNTIQIDLKREMRLQTQVEMLQKENTRLMSSIMTEREIGFYNHPMTYRCYPVFIKEI